MPLSYQADSVNDGYNKMAKHGGFFLSDVVGLGKPIIATRIAKKFYFKNDFPEYRSRTLIVVPPALKLNWEETIGKFSLEIEFPNVRKLEKILYQLAPHLEALYDQTIRQLTHPTEGLTYNRYQAIGALKPHKKQKYKKADLISTQLAKIMKTMLVKRIDSSFFAFRQPIRRFCNANDAMLKMFDTGRVFIAPNLPVSDMINDSREDELFDLVTSLIDLVCCRLLMRVES